MLSKVKKAYYYYFYIIWGMYEGSPNRFASDIKAGAFILVLEGLIWLSFGYYYTVFFKLKALPNVIWLLYGPIVVFAVINYFAFYKNDVWRERIYEFGEWPTNKNKIGAFFVILGTCLIISNFLFSLILLYNR